MKPKINVYIAGSFSQRKKIYRKMKLLENLGFTIAFKWPLYPHMSLDEAAEKEIKGIETCDLFIACFTDPNPLYEYRGTFTELGAALAFKKPIFLIEEENGNGKRGLSESVEPYYKSNCFFHHPDIRCCSTWTFFLKHLPKIIAPPL